jgi:DNA-directed RNA polymerase subunit N (RpoN/RPB10)
MVEGGGGMSEETWRKPLWMYWWELRMRFHRCPECGHWPDRHYDSIGPRWEDDKVAQMLGIAQYGCRRCGEGSIEERDGAA